jgi:hypothetical protein
VSEVVGAGMPVMAVGLSMEQVQGVGRDVVGFVGEQVGAKPVDKTVVAFPGFSQFI